MNTGVALNKVVLASSPPLPLPSLPQIARKDGKSYSFNTCTALWVPEKAVSVEMAFQR